MTNHIEARLDIIHGYIEHLIEGAHVMADCLAEQVGQMEALNQRMAALVPLSDTDRLLASALERLTSNDAALRGVARDLAQLLESARAAGEGDAAGRART
jgi:hypothetical protein